MGESLRFEGGIGRHLREGLNSEFSWPTLATEEEYDEGMGVILDFLMFCHGYSQQVTCHRVYTSLVANSTSEMIVRKKQSWKCLSRKVYFLF